MEERLDIDTPEGVVFGYQVAGIGSRFMAALVDMIVLIILLVTFSCAATVIMSIPLGLEGWLAVVPVLLSFALIWGYYIFFELAWNGQSRVDHDVVGHAPLPGTPVDPTGGGV